MGAEHGPQRSEVGLDPAAAGRVAELRGGPTGRFAVFRLMRTVLGRDAGPYRDWLGRTLVEQLLKSRGLRTTWFRTR
ncbi:MAG: hypothetical protein QOD87_2294 [Pseudonocardiales bacterium]|nr:hypothetical protein [Pseudonocardiales bacterium]